MGQQLIGEAGLTSGLVSSSPVYCLGIFCRILRQEHGFSRLGCRSSGVEHSIGNGEAVSSILTGSTSI